MLQDFPENIQENVRKEREEYACILLTPLLEIIGFDKNDPFKYRKDAAYYLEILDSSIRELQHRLARCNKAYVKIKHDLDLHIQADLYRKEKTG
jgi:hypothetical protein